MYYYKEQLSNLYALGYREIPKDVERVILAKIQHRESGSILKDQTPNPFKAIKAKQRYATLSNGLFDEMHEPVDSIQYYHALLNTKTKKITRLFPIETSNDYKVDPVVFALSVDPSSDKYPNISPYAYCSWNPVKIIDPNGEDGYTVSEDGVFNRIDNTGKDKYDVIYRNAKDEKGNLVKDSKGHVLPIKSEKHGQRVDKGILDNSRTIPTHQQVDNNEYVMTDDKKAETLFKFLANNTEVEWAVTKIGNTSGENGLNVLQTSHDKGKVDFLGSTNDLMDQGWKIRGLDHNHPSNNYTPSGKGGDLTKSSGIHNHYPNAVFRIYTAKDDKFHPFHENKFKW